MPGSLTEYALRLAQDPTELATFRSSQAAARTAMANAGLDADAQALLLSGDQRRIGDAIAYEAASPSALAQPMEAPPGEPMEAPPPGEPMEAPPGEPMEAPPGEPMEAHPHV